MPQIINTNIGSINAQRNLNRSQESLNLSLQRLSSGLRINSAKDDAAGLAISERFTSQIRGTNQAIRNSNDGISVAQVAEGALQESSNILQRIRELAIQSANDSNSASDRQNLQKEVNQLKQELERIATTTSFNGKKLLDGSYSGQQFHIGAFAFETVQVDITNVRNAAIGVQELNSTQAATNTQINAAASGTANGVAAQTLSINGAFGDADIALDANSTASTVVDQVNRASEQTGVQATAITYAQLDTLAGAGAGDVVSFDLYSVSGAFDANTSPGATISFTVASVSDLTALADAINAESGTTGVSATLSTSRDQVLLFNANGDDIVIDNFQDSNAAANVTLNFNGIRETGDYDDFTNTTPVTLSSSTAQAAVGGSVIFTSSRAFQVNSTDGGNTLLANNVSALQDVSLVDISSQRGANDAIAILEGALARLAETRANLGAIQNRLTATISNLENVSENVSAARSRIRDADFAAETAELARSQILQQAGISVLAQANAIPQQVLTLLQ